MFKLYRQPQSGEMSVISADPADAGSDYCAAVAKSKQYGDSFMVFHARMESSQFGHELFKMATFIKKNTGESPWIGVERNVGMATIAILQTLNYRNLFRMPKLGYASREEDEERIGWWTNAQTRAKMLDDLALSLKQRTNVIYDEETILELMAFIRHARTGKPQASAGKKDDLVIAEAIALQLLGMTPFSRTEERMSRINQFPKQQLFDKYGNPNT